MDSLDILWVYMLKINASPYAIGYYPFPNLLEEAWRDAEASTLELMITYHDKSFNHPQSLSQNICVTINKGFGVDLKTKPIQSINMKLWK